MRRELSKEVTRGGQPRGDQASNSECWRSIRNTCPGRVSDV